ncbi:apomucin-like [Castor canadensis]|uniref:Apomucin-like n=1 Tax=Castor canadensis TaxID=51338 RepID=A0AC58NH25_CASCN
MTTGTTSGSTGVSRKLKSSSSGVPTEAPGNQDTASKADFTIASNHLNFFFEKATTSMLSSGIQTGTTVISSKVTINQEVSNPGSTETDSGATVSPGGLQKEATTFKKVVETTSTGISSGIFCQILDYQSFFHLSLLHKDFQCIFFTSFVLSDNTPGSVEVTSSQEGTTGVASGTTIIPGSSSPGTTVAPSRTTGILGISGISGSSNPGTSKEASETTTAPGITITGCPATLPPAPVCHGPLGEEKSPGDIWTSNCHECTCTDAKSVECKPKECPSPSTCNTEEKLITFKSNDSCCEIGHCEPRTCLFNNTDYEIGASFDDPSNPCVSYFCNNTGLVAVVQDCPKQTWCAEEDRIYDSKNCCYKCKNDCRPSPVNVTVKYNGCKKRIEMARCIGECKKTLKYNYELFQLENSCICCREDNYEYRDIALDCSDGTTISYKYRHTTTCSCLDQCEQSQTSVTH